MSLGLRTHIGCGQWRNTGRLCENSPKSTSFTSEDWVRSTLRPLTSRWMTRRSCRNARAYEQPRTLDALHEVGVHFKSTQTCVFTVHSKPRGGAAGCMRCAVRSIAAGFPEVRATNPKPIRVHRAASFPNSFSLPCSIKFKLFHTGNHSRVTYLKTGEGSTSESMKLYARGLHYM